MFKSGAWVRCSRVICLGLLVAASVLAATSAACLAQQPGQVDLQRSRAYVRIGATGLGHEHGAEGRLKSGLLVLGANDRAGELVFDMTTFVTETAAARAYVGLGGGADASTAAKVTANMLGSEVLDVAKYPTATYRVRSSLALPKRQPSDPQSYQLDGEFTLHGVTRPLRTTAVGDEVGGLVHLRGQFSVRQTQFGITPYSKAFGAVGVADELKIWGDLWVTTR
jgi:polyisoprenoid-binding protein YceI